MRSILAILLTALTVSIVPHFSLGVEATRLVGFYGENCTQPFQNITGPNNASCHELPIRMASFYFEDIDPGCKPYVIPGLTTCESGTDRTLAEPGACFRDARWYVWKITDCEKPNADYLASAAAPVPPGPPAPPGSNTTYGNSSTSAPTSSWTSPTSSTNYSSDVPHEGGEYNTIIILVAVFPVIGFLALVCGVIACARKYTLHSQRILEAKKLAAARQAEARRMLEDNVMPPPYSMHAAAGNHVRADDASQRTATAGEGGDGDGASGSDAPGDDTTPGDDNTPGDVNSPGNDNTPGDGNAPGDDNTPGDANTPGDDNTPGDGNAAGDDDASQRTLVVEAS